MFKVMFGDSQAKFFPLLFLVILTQTLKPIFEQGTAQIQGELVPIMNY